MCQFWIKKKAPMVAKYLYDGGTNNNNNYLALMVPFANCRVGRYLGGMKMIMCVPLCVHRGEND